MLELRGLTHDFVKRGALGRERARTRALNGVSLTLPEGKTLGVIGESGSGKSTLARVALLMLKPDQGAVQWRGLEVTGARGAARRAYVRAVQPVFQDSAGALDPRLDLAAILREPLILRGDAPRAEFTERSAEALRSVGLSPDLMRRRPGELSGGQRQRVGVARALLMEPEALILDEPVSALDVSVQARVLNLLMELQEARGLSYLFIGHDLAVAEHLCDEIAVMRRGEVVELASAEQLFTDPQHIYTRSLIAAAPRQIGA